MNNNFTNVFASKEYHFLYWMAQHQINTSSGALVKFSQSELSKEYGCSPATVNKFITSLRGAGCVEFKRSGTYTVTSIGHSVIAKMKEIEKIIGG